MTTGASVVWLPISRTAACLRRRANGGVNIDADADANALPLFQQAS
jgi:hypothetical protein